MLSRPSESLQAVVGTVLGAVFIVLAEFNLELSSRLQGALVILVSYLAMGVTWYVGAKQRAGEIPSLPDGRVG